MISKKKIVDEAYNKAKTIIKIHFKDLHKLAKGLLKHETLTGTEIKDLLKGKKIKKQLAKNLKKSLIRTSVPNSRMRNKKRKSFTEPQLENN